MIAENLYSQIDDEGNQFLMLDEIVDHRTNGSAVSVDDGWVTSSAGKRRRQTTKGWDLLIQWKDLSTSWVPLKDMKESFPIQVAEYAVNNKIAEQPAFAWWVKTVLRKRGRIIEKVQKYWRTTHKYGLEMPHSYAAAMEIDRKTGTTFWRDAVSKEMRNVMMAFEFRDDDIVPPGFTEIKCHLVFDVKMDLTRKARFVAGGHMTDPPKDSTYSSVVTRESVRIALTLAALNDLDVLTCDIQNAYLNAPTKEKVWCRAGDEFGPNAGRPVLIVRALYGLKSSGARFREHLAEVLRDANFVSCKADPDVWLRPGVKPDGTEYYEYVLTYVDDILCCSHDPAKVMETLKNVYKLKDGSVGRPTTYLGADVKEWSLPSLDDPGKKCWGMSSETYVKRVVKDVEARLDSMGRKLATKVTTPLASGYRPELDQSRELSGDDIQYYQGLVGILRWVSELGRLGILIPLSLMSRYLVSPRVGQLEQLFQYVCVSEAIRSFDIGFR